MIAVIFEVYVSEEGREDYLATATALRESLADMDGFISIERFSSLVNEGKMLSLSFWRDEAAVQAWRNLESHRLAQEKGRAGLFREYRLRVAEVLRDYGMEERTQAPADSRAVHDR